VQQRKTEKRLKSWEVAVASEISQLLLLLTAQCCIVGGLIIDILNGFVGIKMHITFLPVCQYPFTSFKGDFVEP
jgi:hypothetical protein